MTGWLKDIWRAPYPAYIASWKTVTVPAAIVFLILYLLEPFGLSRLESGLLWVSLGAALISAGVSSVFVWVLPRLFPRWYAEQGWTLGKEVVNTLALLLSIAVCVWLYVAWLTGMVLSLRLFFVVLLWVLILGAFPTVLFALWNRNIQLARNLRKATEMNRSLPDKPKAEKPSSVPLVFQGDTREALEVDAMSFLYAESEGNYIRLYYLSSQDPSPASKLLRLTMKQAEASAVSAPFIVRCHRAYLVNLRRVTKVDGNSQGCRLRLEGCADEVPVSRSYVKKVQALIAAGKS